MTIVQYTRSAHKTDILRGALSQKHHYYEIMAKERYDFVIDVAVKFWRRSPQNEYQIGPDLDRIIVGVYLPLDENADNIYPVLAFNGTDWGQLTDIQADLNTVSTGLDKFVRYEYKIAKIVKELAEQYGKVVLTGYSLGGCYAQYTALRHWKHVYSLITFQAPPIHKYFESLLLYNKGFRLTTAQIKILKDATHHYQVAGDPVPDGAMQWAPNGKYTPGHRWKFKYNAELDWADSHTKNIFEYFINHNEEINQRKRLPTRDNLRAAANSIRHIDYESIDLANLLEPNQEIINQFAVRRSRLFDDASRAALRLRLSTPNWINLVSEGVVIASTPSERSYLITWLWKFYTFEILRNYQPGITERVRNRSINNLLNFVTEVPGPSRNIHSILQDDEKSYLLNSFNELISELNANLGGFIYIDTTGSLTDAGLEYLKQEDQTGTTGLQDSTIKNIINQTADPNKDFKSWLENENTRNFIRKRSGWQEVLIRQEIIDHFHLVPFLRRNGTSRSNIYMPGPASNEKVYLISNLGIGTIIDTLPLIFNHYGNNHDSFVTSISLIVNVPDGDEDLQDISVYQYLKSKMDSSNGAFYDETLTKAFYTAHTYYIGGLRQDPLDLLPANKRQEWFTDDIENRSGRRSRTIETPYTMTKFRGDALSASQTRGRKTKDIQNIGKWYNFLFAGFDLEGHDKPLESAFLASAFLPPRSTIQNRIERDLSIVPNSLDINDGKLYNLKSLRLKRPDLILIRPEGRTIEVIDPTFRFDTPWHNFKTTYYVSIIKHYLPQWVVRGLDHRDARNQTFI